MELSELRIGSIYKARVSNKITEVYILDFLHLKSGTTILAKNLITKREVYFKDASKILEFVRR